LNPAATSPSTRWALVWLRRDLRLTDQPALSAALSAGFAPILIYIHAPDEEAPWAATGASLAWLHQSLLALNAQLSELGTRLLVRRGPALATLQALAQATGAQAVYWNRLYEPAAIQRDQQIKSALRAQGLEVVSCNGSLLVEPWDIRTGQGDPYRVFTPFWRQASARLQTGGVLPAPSALPALPAHWGSLAVADLQLQPKLGWDRGFWEHFEPGEVGAQGMLSAFCEGAVRGYKEQRNLPDRVGTSRLSPHLHFGEISARQIHEQVAALPSMANFAADLKHFVSELGWREFAHHLLYHFPHTSDINMNPRFADFDWVEPNPEQLHAWQRGRTGIPIVDAGMRELWHTGWMHNRVRMIVASFLCKNLRYHWIHGARWFWDTLLDADLPNNTLGWQWSAGTGADAAPYFRIFSPAAQTDKFDPQGVYIKRWLPELAAVPSAWLAEPWSNADFRRLAPDYPAPILDLKASRANALAAYRGPKQLPVD